MQEGLRLKELYWGRLTIMINTSTPSLRQKQFSELIKRCVSLFFIENQISVFDSIVSCSRVVASRDLKSVDIFIISKDFNIQNLSKFINKKLHIDPVLAIKIKEKISKNLSLKFIPQVSLYLDI